MCGLQAEGGGRLLLAHTQPTHTTYRFDSQLTNIKIYLMNKFKSYSFLKKMSLLFVYRTVLISQQHTVGWECNAFWQLTHNLHSIHSKNKAKSTLTHGCPLFNCN